MNTTTITLLGERIHAARRRARMSQKKFAAAVSTEDATVSRQLVSRWELGGSVPDMHHIARIVLATGYPASLLMEAAIIDLTDGDVGEYGCIRDVSREHYEQMSLLALDIDNRYILDMPGDGTTRVVASPRPAEQQAA